MQITELRVVREGAGGEVTTVSSCAGDGNLVIWDPSALPPIQDLKLWARHPRFQSVPVFVDLSFMLYQSDLFSLFSYDKQREATTYLLNILLHDWCTDLVFILLQNLAFQNKIKNGAASAQHFARQLPEAGRLAGGAWEHPILGCQWENYTWQCAIYC